MNTTWRAACGLALTTLMAGCGGGGSGSDTPYAVATAWNDLIAPSAVRTILASGRGSDGNDYEFELRLTPLGDSAYPKSGAAAQRTDQRISVGVNGDAPVVALQSLYYTGAAQLIGASADDGSCSDIVTTLPPASARIGDSGALYSATDYGSCASGDTTVTSRSSARWSLDDIGGTVYFCVNYSYRDASNNPEGTESDCIEVNPDGSFGTRVRIELSLPDGFSLVATGG